MTQGEARELRLKGITAAKAGQKEQARQFLQQSIRLDPTSEPAWLWLASVARDPRERVFCLRKILEINPNNEQALKALQTVDPQLTTAQQASVQQQPLPRIKTPTGLTPAVGKRQSTQEMMAMAPGVPLPDPDQVAAAQRKAEVIAAQFAQTEPVSQVKWVKKYKDRAGERDVWLLRAVVGIATLAAITLLCSLGLTILSTNFGISIGGIGGVAFNFTPSFTPTMTMTPTPGSTPTPSVTPAVPAPATATIPPAAPTANLYDPAPTSVYPPVLEAPLRGAISLLDAGNASLALPTLSVEIQNTVNRYNPNPYYFQAIAQARLGDTAAALRTLGEAEDRLQEAPNDNFAPLIDTGFAYVHLVQALRAQAQGDRVQFQTLLAEVEARTESAIARDPRLAEAYLLRARAFTASGNTQAGLEALDAGLAIADLRYNAALIAEKAHIYVVQGSFREAQEQADYALYIDPNAETAHQARIAAALALGDPGLASIYAGVYVYHFPGSTEAFRMLGDARAAEGNYDLAERAYTQALTVNQDDEGYAKAFLGRAATYLATRQFDLALNDFSEAFRLLRTDQVRELRMNAALLAGDYTLAVRDADALEASGGVDTQTLALVRARISIERAEAGDEEVNEQIIRLLQAALVEQSDANRALINEFLARAYYQLEEYAEALEAIDASLDVQESVMRHYVRGLILDARGEDDAAAREYEWVLSWSNIFPFPLRDEAQSNLQALR